MAYGSTTVRLTRAEKYPAHGPTDHTKRSRELAELHWPRWRGQTILVELPPQKPSKKWTCGTQYVWRVLTEFEGRDPNAFVCEHDIECD